MGLTSIDVNTNSLLASTALDGGERERAVEPLELAAAGDQRAADGDAVFVAGQELLDQHVIAGDLRHVVRHLGDIARILDVVHVQRGAARDRLHHEAALAVGEHGKKARVGDRIGRANAWGARG